MVQALEAVLWSLWAVGKQRIVAQSRFPLGTAWQEAAGSNFAQWNLHSAEVHTKINTPLCV